MEAFVAVQHQETVYLTECLIIYLYKQLRDLDIWQIMSIKADSWHLFQVARENSEKSHMNIAHNKLYWSLLLYRLQT